MIVHFIGKAGVGKSTLMPVVMTAIEGLSKGKFKSKINTKKRIKNPHVFLMVVFNIITSIPKNFWLTFQLIPYIKIKNSRFFVCWALFMGLILEESRKALVLSNEVFCVDQGFTNLIRKYLLPLPDNIIKKTPLPFAVVNVMVYEKQRQKRILQRNKGIMKQKKITGNDRFSMAEKHSKKCLALLGLEESKTAIKQWNQILCKPPLSSEELNNVYQKVAKHTPKSMMDNNNVSIDYAWMQPLLMKHGVAWVEAENHDNLDINNTAKDIAGILMRCSNILQNPDNKI